MGCYYRSSGNVSDSRSIWNPSSACPSGCFDFDHNPKYETQDHAATSRQTRAGTSSSSEA